MTKIEEMCCEEVLWLFKEIDIFLCEEKELAKRQNMIQRRQRTRFYMWGKKVICLWWRLKQIKNVLNYHLHARIFTKK
jgi:hypothetical protein